MADLVRFLTLPESERAAAALLETMDGGLGSTLNFLGFIDAPPLPIPYEHW